jgi:DNA-binding response OmpR family regulator
MTLRALVLEDDRDTRSTICDHLVDEGFEAIAVSSPETVIETVEQRGVHICVIPARHQGKDCFEIARKLRLHTTTGSIVLGESNDELDIVVALEMGADDYMVKPVRPRELSARIRTILRRTVVTPANEAGARPLPDEYLRRINRLEICSVLRIVSVDGQNVELTPMEFDVLLVLAAQTNIVLSRQQIIAGIRGEGWSMNERSIDQIIGRLRQKLFDGDAEHLHIKTVHGRGYMLIESSVGESS